MSRRSEIDIVFTTDRFNCARPQPHYINDCCFGDDLAAWLAERLRKQGYVVDEPGQEDWGWYLRARVDGDVYFIAIGSTGADESFAETGVGAPLPDEVPTNLGEWRLIVKKHRGLWDMLTGAGRITESD